MSLHHSPLFEVWMSDGHGTHPGPKFRFLEDAERYVVEHGTEASYAVKAPDGEWTLITPRRRLARGSMYR